MFEQGDKVNLIIGGVSFKRNVSEVIGNAVYLEEGGVCFKNDTGEAWGGKVKSKIVSK